MDLPMVAIVGRPNVGKSTLFNKLLKRRVAIEDDQPGVTRDRIHADYEWYGKRFTLVDTGGLVSKTDSEIEKRTSEAAEMAIEQADKIIFVVDGRISMTHIDRQIARQVQKANVPTVLAVTKIDGPNQEHDAWEYMALGLGEPVMVSGINGRGCNDLMDIVAQDFPLIEEEEDDPNEVKLAVIGRPNVGKSSLVNKIIGEYVQIVSNVPGTTRDAIDHEMKYMGHTVKLIDTAGLRKKHELSKGSVDYFTYLRTIKAIDRSTVAAILMDATEGLTQYERRLFDETRQKGKGLIAIFNKWDLVDKETQTMKEMQDEFRLQLPDLSFVPMQFMSALTGKRARKILDWAVAVHNERLKRISTSELNRYVEGIMEKKPPPSVKGRWLKIKYASQVATAPPVFAFHMGDPQLMPETYKRFLERMLREQYGYEGVPLRAVFRKK